MNKPWKLIRLGTLPILVLTLFIGCDKQLTLPPVEKTVPTSTPQTVYLPDNTASDSARDRMTAQPSPNSNDHSAQVSASKPTDGNTGNHGTAAVKPSKPQVDAKDAYKQARPTLMGLSLNTSKETVLNKFGKPKSQFMMDEDTEPVTVYEYTEFSVGFNGQDAVQFVDVHSTEIDPGLGGVRLGQKSAEALKALGKPNSNTTYVISYISRGTVLKFDIDPKKDIILSIKLFAGRDS